MALHKLARGKDIIGKLHELGEILGYYSDTEYVVDEEQNSAVDVAWLFEKGHRYPLFIFEIESATTNSMMANPFKIFGEPNKKFEKPLFLFHLLLKGGQESAKIGQLENQFGTHNYRIYRFSLKEEINLVIDVLSQHRRLTNRLNIIDFVEEIIEKWSELDISQILAHIEEIGFELETGTIIPSYVMLSKQHSLIRPHLLRKLKEKIDLPIEQSVAECYGTYYGNQWNVPIHLGILSAFGDNELSKEYFDLFKNWQENSHFLKQIGPSFGLSRDYDLFILGASGAFLGLLTVLFNRVQGAREYFANELFNIIEKSGRFPKEISLYNSIWLLHIAPDSEKGKEFYEYAKDKINQIGCPEKLYKEPPTEFMEFIEGGQSLEDYGDSMEIPHWKQFRKLKETVRPTSEKLFSIAISILIEDYGDWNPVTNGQL